MKEPKVDKLTIQRSETLHPALIEEFKSGYTYLLKNGIYIRMTCGRRTWAEQAYEYSKGRTIPGPGVSPKRPMGSVVTMAEPGESFHQYGLAFDFCILLDKDGDGKWEASWDMYEDLNYNQQADWEEVVNTFKNKGWLSGLDFKGRFKEGAHLQKTFGLTITQCMELSQRGKISNFTIPGIYQRLNP